MLNQKREATIAILIFTAVMLGNAVIFAIIPYLTMPSYGFSIHPFQIMLSMCAIGLICMLPWAKKHGRKGLATKQWKLYTARGFLEYGAFVLSFTSWRGIFVINLAVGALLVVAVGVVARASEVEEAIGQPNVDRVDLGASRGPRSLLDRLIALVLLAAMLVAGYLTFVQPGELVRDISWGRLFIPYVDGGSRWVTPVGVVTIAAFVLLVAWCWLRPRALVDLRGWLGHLLAADLLGAALLAVVLGGIVLAFATADPEVAVFSPQGPWFLAGSALAAVLLVVHLRRADAPIVPRGALRATPAWGALVVSFLVGWALIAALVDIPLFARTTTEKGSQLGAALVLLRFLAALPVGAVLGGWLLRRVNAGVLTAIGMAAAGSGFVVMGQWDEHSLESAAATVPLVVAGLGFGLALAPVNAAILASTDDDAHGLASALVVVARMVGMLVGISARTTIGLRRLYAAQESDPGLSITDLGILQEQAVFRGAAVAAFAAAVLALVVFARARTREVGAAEVLRAGG